MDILFFVILPLATILIAIVLQKVLQSPTLVAILAFAIYLILAFTTFTEEFLINVVIYTILAFLTAILVKTIYCLINNMGDRITCNDNNENNLRKDISGLENSIDSLENSIDNLNNLITNLIGNSNCRARR